MKLENQVVSQKLSQQLKDLGVKRDSYFFWLLEDDKKFYLESIAEYQQTSEDISAFTVAELGEILKDVDCEMPWHANGSWWFYGEGDREVETKTSEADARAKLLIYLLENELISI